MKIGPGPGGRNADPPCGLLAAGPPPTIASAADYAAYRPGYPPALADALAAGGQAAHWFDLDGYFREARRMGRV